MKTVRPISNVVQLTRLKNFSCHLFEHDDNLTLIDTGFTGFATGILKAAQKLGKPIKRILITHAHGDHAGSLDAVTAELLNLEIIASARTAQFLSGDRSLPPDELGQKLRGGYQTCKTKPTHLIADGETIAGFRALFTPGHAPGHVSYFHELTGNLFCGDALISAAGGLHITGEFRWLFPFPYFSTANRAQALASAKLLRQLNAKAIHPAHGPAILNPSEDINEAVARAEKALNSKAA